MGGRKIGGPEFSEIKANMDEKSRKIPFPHKAQRNWGSFLICPEKNRIFVEKKKHENGKLDLLYIILPETPQAPQKQSQKKFPWVKQMVPEGLKTGPGFGGGGGKKRFWVAKWAPLEKKNVSPPSRALKNSHLVC